MSLTVRTLDVPAEAVFAVLRDPARYDDVVVGAKRIRAYDHDWPAPGTQLAHSSGVGPLVIRDRTEVVEVDPPARLVLRAGLRPLGVTVVAFTLSADGAGTRVAVAEEPVSGPMRRLWNPVFDRAMGWRNAELLRRLEREARREASGPAGGPG